MNRDLVLALHRLGESVSGVFSSPFPLQKWPEVSPLQEQEAVQKFFLKIKPKSTRRTHLAFFSPNYFGMLWNLCVLDSLGSLWVKIATVQAEWLGVPDGGVGVWEVPTWRRLCRGGGGPRLCSVILMGTAVRDHEAM